MFKTRWIPCGLYGVVVLLNIAYYWVYVLLRNGKTGFELAFNLDRRFLYVLSRIMYYWVYVLSRNDCNTYCWSVAYLQNFTLVIFVVLVICLHTILFIWSTFCRYKKLMPHDLQRAAFQYVLHMLHVHTHTHTRARVHTHTHTHTRARTLSLSLSLSNFEAVLSFAELLCLFVWPWFCSISFRMYVPSASSMFFNTCGLSQTVLHWFLLGAYSSALALLQVSANAGVIFEDWSLTQVYHQCVVGVVSFVFLCCSALHVYPLTGLIVSDKPKTVLFGYLTLYLSSLLWIFFVIICKVCKCSHSWRSAGERRE